MDEARAAYDLAAGIEAREEAVSYLREMMLSSPNKAGLAGTVALTAVLAIASGVGIAALPVLFFLMVQSLAALFVPSSPVFRELVDRGKRKERREKVRRDLLARVVDPGVLERHTAVDPVLSALVTKVADLENLRWSPGLEGYRDTWVRMRERLSGLHKLASDRSSALSERDVERLDDATNDYLRLVHARLNLHERMGAGRDREIEIQIADLDAQIDACDNQATLARLEKARASLATILARRRDLPARDTAIAAQLLAMGETFEELVHRVTANPTAGGISDFLHEATERLSIEEELSVAAAVEVDQVDMDRDTRQRLAAVAAKARARERS